MGLGRDAGGGGGHEGEGEGMADFRLVAGFSPARAQLDAEGIEVQDGKDGSKWR